MIKVNKIWALGFILLSVFPGCQKKEKLETSVIKTPTIVCDQCEERIKQAVYILEGVKEVNVDLETKTVEVKYIPLQTNLETIETTISRAGYDANTKRRDPDAYENLPECCKQQKQE